MKLCPRCSEPFPDDAGFCPLDGTALVRQLDPLLGRTLAARYRLVRRLGAGGMAVVYLARHVMIGRLSAIKILRQDLGMNPVHRERFLREARAVNRINHPNIVEITDFGEDGGLVFLVMEYVEGESLLGALRGGPFRWTRAVGIALQIASALERAHELGVIHRDLKPENVLLLERDGAEFVKLTDFGIAKIFDLPTITVTEQRFGTPGYIAPEYVEGSPASPRGDVYALGVVLYEMLTGKLPFDARFPTELLVLPLREPPVKPSARVDGIPMEVEALVLRMIARRPEDRPVDAFAVDDALTALLRDSGGAPAAQPPPSDGDGRSAAATLADDPPADVATRAQESLSELERRIESVRAERGDRDPTVRRSGGLAEVANVLLASLERAKATVARHQARVDELEAHGREFRARLGHATDTLSRDRSRERERLAALAGGAEAAIAKGDAGRVEADLGYQIETLQRQLDIQNGELEHNLAQATGMLEGSLSALRRLTGELLRTIGEAADALR
jgi:serine/threonine protein kinase